MRFVLLCLCAAVPLAAQGPKGGVVFEGYYFGSSYAFDHVVEWTIPVSLSHREGEYLKGLHLRRP